MNKTIINIPLEPLPQRYTIEWRTWFEKYMKPAATIDGKTLTDKIETGAFLDICGTNYFKASQLQGISQIVHALKEVSNMQDVVFFFHDVWFPGIEMLAYMRDGLNLKFKIVGCLHAGTYDKFDYITSKGMGYWGKDIENGWFRIIDAVFVATEWHKRQLIHSRDVDPNKVHVTGFPIFYEHDNMQSIQKENIVVLPNRLTVDKNPQVFEFIKNNLDFCSVLKDWKFVTTFSEDGTFMTKDEYWKLLHQAKIMISFADHENWGISCQEALFAGCFIIVPNKLSYVELYNPIIRYNNFHDLISIIEKVVSAWEDPQHPLWKLRYRDTSYALYRGTRAIPNMLKIMEAF